MKIILASQSPRRKKILKDNGIDFTVDISNAEEEQEITTDVKDLVIKNAVIKAKTVADRNPGSIIIAADTVVFHDNKMIGQQKTDDEAFTTMKSLAGKTHEVYSGICIYNTRTGDHITDYEISHVTLKELSDDTIKAYINTGLYKGKAGAYNIDDPEFECFVADVTGDKTNILGLPIIKVKELIRRIK